MRKEIWKDIPGYEGCYQASDLGRIRSIRFNKDKKLKPSIDGGGYFQLGISKNKQRYCFKVHTLVALTFIGPRPDGLIIDHIDGNKKNNKSDNLQYITSRQNTLKGNNCNKKTGGCSSIYIGVYRDKRRETNPWRAKTKLCGRLKNLGSFATESEARDAYIDFKKSKEYQDYLAS
jgi:hypothetical protein